MRVIPNYTLYGEAAQPTLPERLHCETIADRSSLHGWEIQAHRHDQFCQILMLRSGSCEVSLNERTLHLQGPCVSIVPPLCVHGFRFSPDVDGLVLTVMEQLLDECLRYEPTLRARYLQEQGVSLGAETGGEGAAVMRSLNALEDEFRDVREGRLTAIQAALSLAVVRLGRLLRPHQDEVSQGLSRATAHVQHFRRLIERHFRTERDLAFYAAEVGITPTQLNRVCRQVLGKSSLQLIHARLRVEAERELTYTTLSIKEIAWLLGFHDAAYFTRFFLKQVGCTPGAFREQRRAGRLT